MLRFIHIADIHADKDPIKQAKLQASFDELLDYCNSSIRKVGDVQAVIISGDVWESRQSFDSRSGVTMVHDFLRKLSKLVNFIFIVKGNNAHDEPGSIQLLHKLEPNIYAYEKPAVLAVLKDYTTSSAEGVMDLLREDMFAAHGGSVYVEYIFSLVPYPTKGMITGVDSIDNNNAEFLQAFENVFELIGDITKPFNCPKILGFHGNIVGSRLSSGQSLLGQDIIVSPQTLMKAGCDYYALGHIHMRQFFDDKTLCPMGYSGSLYNKNWGETDPKSFEVIEINEWKEAMHYPVLFRRARAMVKIEAEFQSGEFVISDDQNEALHVARQFSSEVRFRFKINENDLPLFTDAKIEEVKKLFGDDTKIERQIIPAQRESRSEKIIECKGLLEEVTEYAAVIQEEIPPGAIEKLDEMEVLQ